MRTHSSSTRRLANHCAAISGARPTAAATRASCASDGAGHSLYAAARRLSWPVGAPLRRVGGYNARGWLGMMLGVRLWYGFYGTVLTSEDEFERKVDELCRELGQRGKDC